VNEVNFSVNKIIDEYRSSQQSKRKKIDIRSLEKLVMNDIGIEFYQQQSGYYNFRDSIVHLEKETILTPMNTRKQTNEKKPPLRRFWWLEPRHTQYQWDKQTLFQFSTVFSIDYYLENIKYQTLEELEILQCIFRFMKSTETKYILTREERSLMIFQHAKSLVDSEKEKFLGLSQGRKLLNRLQINEHDLYFHVRKEPFIYWDNPNVSREENGEVLIIEGLATYYTVKKLIEENQFSRLGPTPHYLLWGAGKRVEGTLPYFYEIVKQPESLTIRYAGDIDYEGISIYRRLKEKYPNWKISLSLPFYQFLLEHGQGAIQGIPKDQVRNDAALDLIKKEFQFSPHILSIIKRLWMNRERVPQETLNIEHLYQKEWFKHDQ
jgi:hypothetical protein